VIIVIYVIWASCWIMFAEALFFLFSAGKIMIQGIEKDQFMVLVGKDAWFLDKFYRFSPKRAIDFIVKKMGGR